MGANGSSSEAKARSKDIDKSMKAAKGKAKGEMKLLLLGTGQSGKSTVVKQMRVIHAGSEYTAEERAAYQEAIHENLDTAMRVMLEAIASFKLRLSTPELEAAGNAFREGPKAGATPLDLFKTLWADPGLQEAYGRRNEYELSDSTAYFMNAIDRIGVADFSPTVDDVLRVRVATHGIFEYQFSSMGVPWRITDVGGQKGERKRWMQCFENISAVIYVLALNDYDQKLSEAEGGTNKLKESLALFKRTCRSKWLRETPVVLFLNKNDLFREKIGSSNVAHHFPGYKGDSKDPEAVGGFFLEMFRKEKEQIYPHFTTATDTDNIKHVFADVANSIRIDRMKEFHLL